MAKRNKNENAEGTKEEMSPEKSQQKEKSAVDATKKKRKKYERKGVQTTERDKDVFRFMRAGQFRLEQIWSHLGKTPRLDRFKNRIKVLLDFGYLQKNLYWDRQTGIRASYYALDDLGTECLCMLGYRREGIRDFLPHEKHLDHEIHVTSIYAKVIDEHAKWEFDLVIFDERGAKSENLALGRRKQGYADMTVKLTYNLPDRKDSKQFCIEYDNGSTPAMRFIRKLDALEIQTLVICIHQERIDTLKRATMTYAQTENERLERLRKSGKQITPKMSLITRLHFCTYNEFTSEGGGIHLSDWQKANGSVDNVLRPDRQPVPLRKETYREK